MRSESEWGEKKRKDVSGGRGRGKDFHESGIRGTRNHDTAQSSTVNDAAAISDRRVPPTIPAYLYGTTYRSNVRGGRPGEEVAAINAYRRAACVAVAQESSRYVCCALCARIIAVFATMWLCAARRRATCAEETGCRTCYPAIFAVGIQGI